MSGTRNEHETSGPSAAARFELAYSRLQAQDEARSLYLARICKAEPKERLVCHTKDCGSPVHARGLCRVCYLREWKAKGRE